MPTNKLTCATCAYKSRGDVQGEIAWCDVLAIVISQRDPACEDYDEDDTGITKFTSPPRPCYIAPSHGRHHP